MNVEPSSPPGLLSRVSPHSLDDTLAKLRQAITQKGLTLVCEVDHASAARSVGLEMHPAHVLIFGNPTAGTPLMKASPLVALDLPLKVLVWQDEDGTVRVSYLDAAYLVERYHVPTQLARNIAGLDALVTGVVGRGRRGAMGDAALRPGSETWRVVLVVALTIVTGATDVASFIRFGGVFTSFLTVNVVLLGLLAGQRGASLAIHTGVALAGYVVGVIAGYVGRATRALVEKYRAEDSEWLLERLVRRGLLAKVRDDRALGAPKCTR